MRCRLLTLLLLFFSAVVLSSCRFLSVRRDEWNMFDLWLCAERRCVFITNGLCSYRSLTTSQSMFCSLRYFICRSLLHKRNRKSIIFRRKKKMKTTKDTRKSAQKWNEVEKREATARETITRALQFLYHFFDVHVSRSFLFVLSFFLFCLSSDSLCNRKSAVCYFFRLSESLCNSLCENITSDVDVESYFLVTKIQFTFSVFSFLSLFFLHSFTASFPATNFNHTNPYAFHHFVEGNWKKSRTNRRTNDDNNIGKLIGQFTFGFTLIDLHRNELMRESQE